MFVAVVIWKSDNNNNNNNNNISISPVASSQKLKCLKWRLALSSSAFWSIYTVLISAPGLGVYYLLSLTLCLSVCLSVTDKLQIDSSFLKVSRWNRAIFGSQFSTTPSTNSFSSIFDLGPLTPKNLLPKIGTKSPISLWVTESVVVGINGSLSQS